MPTPSLPLSLRQQAQLLVELAGEPNDAPLKAAVLHGRVPVTLELLGLLREMAEYPDTDQIAWQALYREACTLGVLCAS